MLKYFVVKLEFCKHSAFKPSSVIQGFDNKTDANQFMDTCNIVSGWLEHTVMSKKELTDRVNENLSTRTRYLCKHL